MAVIFKREKAGHIELKIDDQSTRAAYRVVPDRDEPVILQVEGELARVLDISAGGFSCLCAGLQLNMRYRVVLDLPDEAEPIEAFADVIKIDEDTICRCRLITKITLWEVAIYLGGLLEFPAWQLKVLR